MNWQKSSFCKTDHVTGNCVEVSRHINGNRSVRSSITPESFVVFTDDEWDAFVQGVKAGEFD